jgi:hypothetical protein
VRSIDDRGGLDQPADRIKEAARAAGNLGVWIGPSRARPSARRRAGYLAADSSTECGCGARADTLPVDKQAVRRSRSVALEKPGFFAIVLARVLDAAIRNVEGRSVAGS